MLKIRQSDILSKNLRFWGYNKMLFEGDVFKILQPAYVEGFIPDPLSFISEFYEDLNIKNTNIHL